MSVELKVPEVGESITEVQVGSWLKQPGEFIHRDEPVVEIETDKATVELPAPVSGVITEVRKQAGDGATVGEIIGLMEEREAPEKPQPEASADAAQATDEPSPVAASAALAAGSPAAVMPAAKRVMAEEQVQAEEVQATGRGGRVLKEDVERHVAQRKGGALPSEGAPSREGRSERTVRMSPMRKTIAARLVQAQQTAALLTTFNEIDMHEVKQLRAELQEDFQNRFGIKLGFMSFFVKAAVEGLKEFPAINAEIRGDEIVYHGFYDVGIAVSTAKGLVVPVLRDAERMTLATIERRIADFGARAKENKIAIAELEGGTFTISNGGVFGSLLSTPIVNPPQSGVLGMHAIQERPVACDGEVVIRPMMYVALTYDHRIVDGREAVSFLKRIKELIEKPARLLLEG